MLKRHVVPIVVAVVIALGAMTAVAQTTAPDGPTDDDLLAAIATQRAILDAAESAILARKPTTTTTTAAPTTTTTAAPTTTTTAAPTTTTTAAPTTTTTTAAPTTTTTAAPTTSGSCTRTVAAGSDITSANPGDVLCLPAGTRGRLIIENVSGTAADPVVIRNDGGVTLIDGGSGRAVEFRNSKHIRMTGTGVASSCGASVAESAQACGIQVTSGNDGIKIYQRSEYVTVDHVEVFDVGDVAVGSHDSAILRSSGFVQHDVAFRDLWIHDVPTGEGHYHGASGYPNDGEHLLDGVEVTRNLVQRTGRDGIQVGTAPRVGNCTIQDNIVRDVGLTHESSHMFGVVLNRGSSCDVLRNSITNAGREGVYDQGLGGNTVADNVIANVGTVQTAAGIDIREGNQSATNPDTPDYPRSTDVLRNSIDRATDSPIEFCRAGDDNDVIGNTATNSPSPMIDVCSSATIQTS